MIAEMCTPLSLPYAHPLDPYQVPIEQYDISSYLVPSNKDKMTSFPVLCSLNRRQHLLPGVCEGEYTSEL